MFNIFYLRFLLAKKKKKKTLFQSFLATHKRQSYALE